MSGDPRPSSTIASLVSITHQGAPPEAMQFGRALERVLRKVATADPTQGLLYLLKIDLSDGFYRVCLRVQDAPMLGVAFPVAPGEPLLTAIPLVLPMGWTESPPYFCTTTETIVDLANLYSHSMGPTFTPSRGPQCHSGSVGCSSHHHGPTAQPTSRLTAKSRGDAVSSHPVTATGASSPLRQRLHRQRDPSRPRSCSRSQ